MASANVSSASFNPASVATEMNMFVQDERKGIDCNYVFFRKKRKEFETYDNKTIDNAEIPYILMHLPRSMTWARSRCPR